MLQCEKRRGADNRNVVGGVAATIVTDLTANIVISKSSISLFVIVVGTFKYHALTAATVNRHLHLVTIIFFFFF